MNSIADLFHKKGNRLTTQRNQILQALTSYPQDVSEIISTLKGKKTLVDKATVYRSLACFERLGIVAKTQFKDKTAKYELAGKSHHHHLVCENCGAIQDIALEEDFLIKKVSKLTNFKIKNHSLEFFGLCSRCQ